MNHRCTLQCSFWLLQVDNHLTATLMSTQRGLKRWWRGETNHDDDHTHFVWNVFARNTGEATRVSSSRWLYKRQFPVEFGWPPWEDDYTKESKDTLWTHGHHICCARGDVSRNATNILMRASSRLYVTLGSTGKFPSRERMLYKCYSCAVHGVLLQISAQESSLRPLWLESSSELLLVCVTATAHSLRYAFM